MRPVLLLALIVLQIGMPDDAAGQPDLLEFEVASVRPTSLDITAAVQAMRAGTTVRAGKQIREDRVEYIGMTLDQLICDAYGVIGANVVGPDWLRGPRFDIVAKLPAGSGKEDAATMLQNLLRERFKLTTRRELREQRVIALVAGKGDLKLKETPLEVVLKRAGSIQDAVVEPNQPGDSVTITHRRGQAILRITIKSTSVRDPVVHVDATAMKMADLAKYLTGGDRGLVVDATDLGGYYDLSFDMLLSEMNGGISASATESEIRTSSPAQAASTPVAVPTLVQSLRSLGLDLANRKMAVPKLIIDHIERTPTEN